MTKIEEQLRRIPAQRVEVEEKEDTLRYAAANLERDINVLVCQNTGEYGNSFTRMLIDVDNLADAAHVLTMLKANAGTTHQYATNKGTFTIESPFRLDIQHYINSRARINITYRSDVYVVNLSILADLMPSFIGRIERAVDSSEYHYFTGVSLKSLQTLKTHSVVFASGSTVNYGCGYSRSTDVGMTNRLINTILRHAH